MDLLTRLQEALPHIPQDNFLSSEKSTEKYGPTTFSEPIRLNASIFVENRTWLFDIVKLANQLDFAILPISTGNNWGYGAFQPDTGRDTLLLDLSGMKQIYPCDKELGLITVEPGVTQQMLCDYLNKNGWHFMTPVTGAGPHCGILSNALERGYGITPRTEHFDAVTSVKAIIPHPDLCHQELNSAVSELDRSGEDFIDKTFKYGLGPYLDGIFTQSNLAIVTECTIRLAPVPDAFCAFFVRCYGADDLPQIVSFIRTLLRDYEGIVGSINLMDKRRLVAMSAENPNGPAAHRVMTDEQFEQMADQANTPEWLVVGSIYGDKEIVAAVKKRIRLISRNIGKTLFTDSALFSFGRWVTENPVLAKIDGVKKFKKQLEALQQMLQIMQGTPNQVALPLAYWRNPQVKGDKTTTLSPARDNCGLLWYAPLIPMGYEKITEFVEFIRQTTPGFGIEPLITFTNLRHDCIDSTVPIVFNNHDPNARNQAFMCIDKLVEEGLSRGFVPYRLNTMQQRKLLVPDSHFWQTVGKIKIALDPNGIVNPGRYNPRDLQKSEKDEQKTGEVALNSH